jgi:UrcA family protein
MKNYTARIAGLATLALAALPAVALTTAAHAQSAPHTSVQVGDLNLGTDFGRSTYAKRVDAAARRFCSNETSLGIQAACETAVRAEIDAKTMATRQFASRS